MRTYLIVSMLGFLISCGENRGEAEKASISPKNLSLTEAKAGVFAPKKRVIVIAGQSNALGWANKMDLSWDVLDHGFMRTKVWDGKEWQRYALDNRIGLEPSLAYKYETEYPDDLLYIVKHAVDATTLEKGRSHWHPEDGAHYKFLVDSLYKPALKSLGSDVEVMAFLWFQGESDSLVKKKAKFNMMISVINK